MNEKRGSQVGILDPFSRRFEGIAAGWQNLEFIEIGGEHILVARWLQLHHDPLSLADASDRAVQLPPFDERLVVVAHRYFDDQMSSDQRVDSVHVELRVHRIALCSVIASVSSDQCQPINHYKVPANRTRN